MVDGKSILLKIPKKNLSNKICMQLTYNLQMSTKIQFNIQCIFYNSSKFFQGNSKEKSHTFLSIPKFNKRNSVSRIVVQKTYHISRQRLKIPDAAAPSRKALAAFCLFLWAIHLKEHQIFMERETFACESLRGMLLRLLSPRESKVPKRNVRNQRRSRLCEGRWNLMHLVANFL